MRSISSDLVWLAIPGARRSLALGEGGLAHARRTPQDNDDEDISWQTGGRLRWRWLQATSQQLAGSEDVLAHADPWR